MSEITLSLRLVADIGGTNTRIALYDARRNEYRAVREYTNRDHGGLPDILADWLGRLDEPPPVQAAIAVAAPLADDRVSMVNIGWQFSRNELQTRFGWRSVRWLNDFEANAHALPHLGDTELVTLHQGEAPAMGKLAVVGPGTGLGGATLQWVDGAPLANAAEPGHAGLSPGNDLELDVFRHLLRRYPDIYTELLVSGPGLALLYKVVAELHGEVPADLTPAAISERATAGTDPRCTQALAVFCGLFGSACGDFVLDNGAWGGLYIAGGIVPRILEFFRGSDFLDRLRAKGALRDALARLPVHVITTTHPGLVGAAHAPL